MSDNVNVLAFPAGKRSSEVSGSANSGETVDPALFKQGMRRLAAGVTIIATDVGGARHGIVATAVSSVSADPPTLLVCVSETASAHAFIGQAGFFSVNVLHADDQALAEHFANPAKRAQRFDLGEWSRLTTGAPILLSALASFDCRLTQKARVGSHTVFFGQVEHLYLREGAVDPLLFWNGAYRRGHTESF